MKTGLLVKYAALLAVAWLGAGGFAEERLALFESDPGALESIWQGGMELRGVAFSDRYVYAAYPKGIILFNRYGGLVRVIPVKHEVRDLFWCKDGLCAAVGDWKRMMVFSDQGGWVRCTGSRDIAGEEAFRRAKRRASKVPEGLEVPEGCMYLPVTMQGHLPRFGKASFVDKVFRIEYFELEGGRLRDITKCRSYKKGVGAIRSDCQPRLNEDRRALIDPVDEGDLRLRPTFTSCSVSFGCNEYPTISFEYRKVGSDKWLKAKTPPNYKETREFRGALVNLEEDTEYEVRFVTRARYYEPGRTMTEGRFRTWASEVPVAKTIEIDPATAKFPITVSDRGTPEGWIRYTAKDGKPLIAKGAANAFVVRNAAYVILENMDLSGNNGGSVITLNNSHAVRLRNLNIHDWSEPGVGVYTEKGLGRFVRDPNVIRWGVSDYGVLIGSGMTETVVERCYIHDPRNRSCSWYYSHPCGPMAILAGKPDHSTVIRYNDFVGSDIHAWDDAIGGQDNFMEDGGFNRDADIYGNFFIFANDDCIELDGGQQNIRVFGNRFESALVGVSVQGNTVSPSFVYRNLFTGMGEMMGRYGETIKSSGADLTPFENRTYIWNNTLWGRGSGFSSKPLQIADVRNNILVGPSQDFGPFYDGAEDGGVQRNTRFYSNTVERVNPDWPGVRRAKTEFVDLDKTDLTPTKHIAGSAIANFIPEKPVQGAVQMGETAGMWPLRPIPFTLDTLRVDLGKRREFKVTARAAKGVSVPFEIAVNTDFPWLKVEPASGELKDGTVFTVTLDDSQMTERHFYRGAFLVRTKEGLSRPVSVYAETDWQAPIECAGANFAAYAKKDETTGVSGGWSTYTFEVPKKGTYWFFIHGKTRPGAPPPRYRVKVDGGAEGMSEQQATSYYSWTMLAPDRRFGAWIRQYDFEPGKHTISLKLSRDDFEEWDAIAISDSPGAFDLR